METAVSRPHAKHWLLSIVVAIVGVGWQYVSLWWVEKLVTTFPHVPDVLMDKLPRVEFGVWGEVTFLALILTFAIPHFRYHAWDTPRILVTLGLWYFIRGWFMLLLPLGAPLNAVPPEQRLNVWGFASHAFFPGGHFGVLTILALQHQTAHWRRWMWIGIVLFGFGSILSKNHYTIDLFASLLLAYGLTTWVNRRWGVVAK